MLPSSILNSQGGGRQISCYHHDRSAAQECYDCDGNKAVNLGQYIEAYHVDENAGQDFLC